MKKEDKEDFKPLTRADYAEIFAFDVNDNLSVRQAEARNEKRIDSWEQTKADVFAKDPELKKAYEEEFNPREDDVKIKPLKDVVDEKDLEGDAFSIGFDAIDEAMDGGLRSGDLVIVSGISGHGKTTLAQTMTYHLAKQAIPTAWFSYEVSKVRLHQKFKDMKLEDNYNFVFSPEKNASGKIEWLKRHIKKANSRYLCQAFFIDHIDFLTPTDIKKSDNEALIMKKITTQLKDLAVELNVIIVLMAHVKKLPRGIEEPEMQDIGYSAGIFQLADYVMLINRKRDKTESHSQLGGVGQRDIYLNESQVKLVKNRLTGETKAIEVIYQDNRFQTYGTY